MGITHFPVRELPAPALSIVYRHLTGDGECDASPLHQSCVFGRALAMDNVTRGSVGFLTSSEDWQTSTARDRQYLGRCHSLNWIELDSYEQEAAAIDWLLDCVPDGRVKRVVLCRGNLSAPVCAALKSAYPCLSSLVVEDAATVSVGDVLAGLELEEVRWFGCCAWWSVCWLSHVYILLCGVVHCCPVL